MFREYTHTVPAITAPVREWPDPIFIPGRVTTWETYHKLDEAVSAWKWLSGLPGGLWDKTVCHVARRSDGRFDLLQSVDLDATAEFVGGRQYRLLETGEEVTADWGHFQPKAPKVGWHVYLKETRKGLTAYVAAWRIEPQAGGEDPPRLDLNT